MLINWYSCISFALIFGVSNVFYGKLRNENSQCSVFLLRIMQTGNETLFYKCATLSNNLQRISVRFPDIGMFEEKIHNNCNDIHIFDFAKHFISWLEYFLADTSSKSLTPRFVIRFYTNIAVFYHQKVFKHLTGYKVSHLLYTCVRLLYPCLTYVVLHVRMRGVAALLLNLVDFTLFNVRLFSLHGKADAEKVH